MAISMPLDLSRSGQKVFFTVFIIGLACVLTIIWAVLGGVRQMDLPINYLEQFSHYEDNDQYALLGDALIHGRLSLDLPVADELLALDNPYDFSARAAISDGGAVPIYWDHAYYDGSYYCYFGVVPAVLLYVPWQLITGQWLSTSLAVAILGFFAVICLSLLVLRIATRYFSSSATVGAVVIAMLFMFAGCNVVYLVSVPRVYSVPILTSLIMTGLGLWFWMGARIQPSSPAHSLFDSHPLRIGYLILGSVCMAANLGCRPQFVLACVLAFPIFWREIVYDRLFFSWRGLAPTLAVILPMIAVWIPLLWYNYARFGSLFNFGIAYNLTGFDSTDEAGYWDRAGVLSDQLYCYLIQPVDFTKTFPFIRPAVYEFSEVFVPTEPMYGGYFWLVPIALLIFWIPFGYRVLHDRGVFGLSIFMLVLAVVIMIIDPVMCGVSQRYFTDFAWYLMAVSVIAWFGLQARWQSSKPNVWRWLGGFAIAALVVSAGIGAASLMTPEHYDSIVYFNPELYQPIASLFNG